MNIDVIAIFILKSIIGVIEAFMGIRFFLKILGASQQAPFVQWVYATSDSFLDPFRGMFPTIFFGQYFVIELSTLFAMIVYALFGFFAIKLVDFAYKHIVENLTGVPQKSTQQANASEEAQAKKQIDEYKKTHTTD